MTTLLVDADIYIYQAAARAEFKHDWGDGVFTWAADAKTAASDLDVKLARLMETLHGDRMVLAIKSGTNWRRAVYSGYKANRQDTKEPLARAALMEHVKANYEVFQRNSLEGDDVLGILATHPRLIEGEKIIVSIDKDMRSIPALVYNPDHPERGVQPVPEADADAFHMYQTLVGDKTDNYPGLAGCGPKKADLILASCLGGTSMWQAVVKAFTAAGSTEEFALTMARIARICRWTDYNYRTKEVILWTPPPTLGGTSPTPEPLTSR